MNKKIITTITVVFVLAAGVVFAGFLDIYGTLEGASDVLAPEFYVESNDTDTLLVNEKPGDCDSFEIENTYRTFVTDPFENELNFSYSPQATFKVRAKAATTSEVATGTTPKLRAAFGYYESKDGDPDGTETTEVCSASIEELDSEFEEYEIESSCNKPEGAYRFYYEFEKEVSTSSNWKYTIDKCEGDFYTGVEFE